MFLARPMHSTSPIRKDVSEQVSASVCVAKLLCAQASVCKSVRVQKRLCVKASVCKSVCV